MNDELYDVIYEALSGLVKPDNESSRLFLQEVSQIAAEASGRHLWDMLESIGHLQETVHRLSKEG